MAWNGSTNVGGTTPAPKKPAKKSPGLAHGLIAGGAIVLIGVISLYFVTSESDEQPAEKKGPAQIADAEPDLSERPEVVEKKVEPPREKTVNEKHLDWLDKKLKAARDKARAQGLPWADRPRKVIKPRPVVRRFEYWAEEHIASILETEPGQMIIGEFEFGDDFIEELKQSFAFKVKIDPKDDDYTKELKRMVQETKDDLYKRYLDGEDIGKLMRESRKELQSLARVKMEIDSAMSQVFEDSDNLSADDMKDFEAAANKILENKGIPPMEMPKYWRHRIALKESQMKGEYNE